MITNQGALALTKFIRDEDSTLINVNVNRNRITVEGIESLLDTVHQTIRITNFEACFGNNIPNLAHAAFEQEIKAN